MELVLQSKVAKSEELDTNMLTQGTLANPHDNEQRYDKHTLFRRFVDKVKKSDNNTVKNLRISHDLTRCQREEEAKLAKEA